MNDPMLKAQINHAKDEIVVVWFWLPFGIVGSALIYAILTEIGASYIWQYSLPTLFLFELITFVVIGYYQKMESGESWIEFLLRGVVWIMATTSFDPVSLSRILQRKLVDLKYHKFAKNDPELFNLYLDNPKLLSEKNNTVTAMIIFKDLEKSDGEEINYLYHILKVWIGKMLHPADARYDKDFADFLAYKRSKHRQDY